MKKLALALAAFALLGNAPEDPRIDEAKAYVAEVARDPDSVQYRDLRIVDHVLDDEGAQRSYLNSGTRLVVMCGEMNAKNAFGGYTGWKKVAVFLEGRDYERVAIESRQNGYFYFSAVCPASA